MNPDFVAERLAPTIIGAPFFAFVVLAVLFLARPKAPPERFIARLVTLSLVVSWLASLALAVATWRSPQSELTVHLGKWFVLRRYGFHASLHIDKLSMVLLPTSTSIALLGQRFSETYLHRDRGFLRYFALISLFAASLFLLLLAGTMDLLFVGWELVGLTSVFLIAYFQERRGPVEAGFRALVIYRVADMGLILGSVLLHHYAHTAELDTAFGPVHWPLGIAHLNTTGATLVSLCLILAAIGKSGAFPLGGWLPRAMEGPTPSSALFYGGLSVTAGLYLLLRVAPLLGEAPAARAVLLGIGLITAFFATGVARVQTDAKSQLAYATMTQVGIILIEISLGFYLLALLHTTGHLCLRTYQVLRAPTALYDMHRMHAANGGEVLPTGRHIEAILPAPLQRRLYSLALQRFALDELLERVFVRPILSLAEKLEGLEQRWVGRLAPAEERFENESESAPTSTRAMREI